MCRLFSLYANKPVSIDFSFNYAERSILSLSKNNDDGWGVAWYKNGRPALYKNPLAAFEDNEFSLLAKSISSSLVISHVRAATGTPVSYENTHPFKFGNWVFAHNGQIEEVEKLISRLTTKYRKCIKGQTDSEVYFYWILQNVEEQGMDKICGIKRALSGLINDYKFTSLNFLLADGISLYAFRYDTHSNSYYSLYYLKRDKDIPWHGCSGETLQLIGYKNGRNEKAVLVATERMTSYENWKEIPRGSLATINSDLSVVISSVI